MGNATIKKNNDVFSIVFKDKYNRIAPILSAVSTYSPNPESNSEQKVNINLNLELDSVEEPDFESVEERKRDRRDRRDRAEGRASGVAEEVAEGSEDFYEANPEAIEIKTDPRVPEQKSRVECVICTEEKTILDMVKGYYCEHSVCVVCSSKIEGKCPFCRAKFFEEEGKRGYEFEMKHERREQQRSFNTPSNEYLAEMLISYLLYNQRDTNASTFRSNYTMFKRSEQKITDGYIGTLNARRDTQLFITPDFHIGHLNNAVKYATKIRHTRNYNVMPPVVRLHPYIINNIEKTITCIHSFSDTIDLVFVFRDIGDGSLRIKAFFMKKRERHGLVHGNSSSYTEISLSAPKVVGLF